MRNWLSNSTEKWCLFTTSGSPPTKTPQWKIDLKRNVYSKIYSIYLLNDEKSIYSEYVLEEVVSNAPAPANLTAYPNARYRRYEFSVRKIIRIHSMSKHIIGMVEHRGGGGRDGGKGEYVNHVPWGKQSIPNTCQHRKKIHSISLLTNSKTELTVCPCSIKSTVSFVRVCALCTFWRVGLAVCLLCMVFFIMHVDDGVCCWCASSTSCREELAHRKSNGRHWVPVLIYCSLV